MEIDKKNDPILVMGATGFVGKRVVKELMEKGYEKVWGIGSQDCDLRNQADTNNFIWRWNPSIIIFLSANVGGIGKNLQCPGELCYDNLIMGVNTIEASRLYCQNLKKFVLLGSTCSYPQVPKTIPFVEEELFDGMPEITNSGYGIVKRTLIKLIQTYREQYNFPGISLIPTNLYGPGDSLDLTKNHVIPAIISKILKAKSRGDKYVEIWGNGSASREFLYIDDICRAIVMAMEKYEKPDPVNIGTGKEIKISELLDILLNKIAFSGYIMYDKTKPNGQPRRCLDVSRAEKEFGFVAETSLEEGLDRTIEWVKSQTNSYYGDAVINYPIIDVRKK
jgi:GDP-L-fucose synthase